jgi:dipeptidyl aminopeptidase/acylaminoacyl peptidase
VTDEKSLLPKVALIVLMVMVPRSGLGQKLAPLPIEDVLDIQEFGAFTPVQFSPDGKWVVYTVRRNRNTSTYDPLEYARTGVSTYAKAQDICIANTDTLENRNLTEGRGANWAPAWSPDGRFIAFFSDRDGSGQAKLWVWEAAKANLRKVSDVAVRSWDIEWLANSSDVVIATLPENLNPDEYAKLVLPSGSSVRDRQQGADNGPTVMLYKAEGTRQEDRSAPASEPWSLAAYLRDLSLVNVRTSKVQHLVQGKRIVNYLASPSGAHVAFTTPTHFEEPRSQQILWELSVVAIDTHELRRLASDIRFDYNGKSFSWSLDSSHLAYLTGGPLETTTGTADCYIVDLKGGAPQNVTKFDERGPRDTQRAPLWNPGDESIYFIRGNAIWKTGLHEKTARQVSKLQGQHIAEFVAQKGSRLWSPDGGKSAVVLTFDEKERQSGFYKVELESGEVTRLWKGAQCNTCVNTDDHVFGQLNRLAYFSQDSQHYDDLWVTDSEFCNPKRLTHLNPQLDKYQMGAARLIEWRSLDGDTLRGTLLLPAGYQERKRYPLVVWVYGGARGSDHLNYFGLEYGTAFNLQLLATRGYAVLFPDAPQRLGTPLVDLAKAVLPGIDKVIEMGIGDGDRLGVMGHSYGGYSALSLLVQTRRFKAAMMIDGVGDLIGSYGQMGVDGTAFGTSVAEQGQQLMGGTPWEFRDRYIENSPIFFLDRIETPLLIVHGTEDTTVAPFLSDEVFVGLRRLGKVAEYAKYRGEGHSPIYWSYSNQVDFDHRMINWFDGHLK